MPYHTGLVGFEMYRTAHQWSKEYPDAKGHKQSPIDINPYEAVFDRHLARSRLFFDYHSADFPSIENCGHTFVIPAKDGSISSLRAPGFLKEHYRLAQMHGHWGSDAKNGSEHAIGGEKFAAELHLVHSASRFSTCADATKHLDGLAVIAVLIEQGEHNPNLDQLCKAVLKIPHDGDVWLDSSGFDINNFLPSDHMHFWSYSGSLTTPPCSECVKWAVMRHRITASAQQIECFRTMWSLGKGESNSCPIVNNIRPIQAVNGRYIDASFHWGNVE